MCLLLLLYVVYLLKNILIMLMFVRLLIINILRVLEIIRWCWSLMCSFKIFEAYIKRQNMSHLSHKNESNNILSINWLRDMCSMSHESFWSISLMNWFCQNKIDVLYFVFALNYITNCHQRLTDIWRNIWKLCKKKARRPWRPSIIILNVWHVASISNNYFLEISSYVSFSRPFIYTCLGRVCGSCQSFWRDIFVNLIKIMAFC